MVKAEDLVGKSYGEANALTGLEFNLRDHNTDHHLIQDLAQAETYLGIAEALQPENNSPTLTQKFSRLRNLSDYVSSRFNNFKHTKTAAALAAAGMISAVTFGALTKDLGVELPDIVMENAKAQSPADNDSIYNTTKLTDNSSAVYHSHIYNNRVIWTDIFEDQIQVLDLNTNKLNSINADNVGRIDIYEDDLVYEQSGAIWHTNLNTIKHTKISEQISEQVGGILSTDGKYAIWLSPEKNTYLEVKNLDDGSNFNFTIDDNDLFAAEIYNGKIVLQTKESGKIFLVDLNEYEKTDEINYKQISDCESTDPRIDKNTAIWACNNEVSDYINVYDLETKSVIKTFDIYWRDPIFYIHSLNNGNIAWSNSAHLNIFNISKGTNISTRIDFYKVVSLDIWENKVVWSDSGNIYLADFSFNETVPLPPPKPICSDDLDNDNDGLVDYPNDPGCLSEYDDNEWNETIPIPIPTEEELELKLIEKHSPTYLFSRDEKYFPTNPYADDSDVTNNALNWQKSEFSNDKAIYYAVTDYSDKVSTEHPKGFKVIQYWSHYVYNDWGVDEHEYDWEVIHKWIDNKNGEVFHTSSSMHLWDNNYQENIDTFWVEEGGHGTSKDLFMLDHIEMSFTGEAIVQDKNSYELHPLEDLLKYDASDFWGERGKYPTDQERFKDPDNAIRLNPTRGVLTQVTIKNSPELYVVDSAGRTTVLKNGKI